MFKNLAAKKPVLFGVLITFMILLLYIITAVIAGGISQDSADYNYYEAIGRAAASIVFLLMLWRMNWLKASGVTTAGSLTVWILIFFFVVYEAIAYQFALFGSFGFSLSDPGLALPVGLNALASGPIEELPFRAIILYAFIRLWGNTRQGIIRSVIYSSAIFGFSRSFHILPGIPPAVVGMKIVMTFLSGIYYAALVLRWKTIWTVVLLHGITNSIMSLRAVEIQGFSETVPGLGIVILMQVPLVIFGIYVISKLPMRKIIPEAI